MIRDILLDADGVLVNFVQASLDAHGRLENHDDVKEWDYYYKWGMKDDEFWSKIRGHEFWASIKPYPWADELYKELCNLGRVTIVTSPCDDDFCSAGKNIWIRKHFGLRPKDYFIGGRKELLANPYSVLIDDSEINIAAFRKAGGHTILFPQPWNAGTGVYFDVIKRVKELINDN